MSIRWIHNPKKKTIRAVPSARSGCMAPGGSTNRAPVDESSSKNALDAGNQSRLDEFLRHVMAPAIVRALLDPSNQADEGSAKPIGSRKGAP